jgi:hypothetical protein
MACSSSANSTASWVVQYSSLIGSCLVLCSTLGLQVWRNQRWRDMLGMAADSLSSGFLAQQNRTTSAAWAFTPLTCSCNGHAQGGGIIWV